MDVEVGAKGPTSDINLFLSNSRNLPDSKSLKEIKLMWEPRILRHLIRNPGRVN